MKRNVIAMLVGGALVLSACSGFTGRDDTARPASFPSSSPAPAARATSVEQVVRDVLPAVVNVVTDGGEGTGFVVREDGIVVTNAHVVENATSVDVVTSAEDPETYDAVVIGGDLEADLAVLEVDAVGLPTVPLGSSSDLRLGQDVVAIGYALGLQGGPSVTAGIVSSLSREITVSDPGCRTCTNQSRTYGEVIQTDAAINPGNSGGPLVDMAGNVVGINTAGNTAAENVGFAIQIDAAKPVIFGAAESPNEPVAFMGISAIDASHPQFRFEFDPAADTGAGIIDVVPGGPADDAGVVVGDVIVEFDGEPITNNDELGSAIRAQRPDDRVDVEIVRSNGERLTLGLTLGTHPSPLG